MPIKRQNIRLLWRLLRPHQRHFNLLMALLCLNALAMAVADPLATKFLIDTLTEGDARRFASLAVVVVLLATMIGVATYLATLIGKRLKNKIHKALTIELSQAYYRLPYTEITRNKEGYYISRLHDEPKQVTEAVDAVGRLFALSLQALGALSIALWLSWQVTVALLVVVPVLVYISRRYSRRIADSMRGAQEAEASFKSILGRVIGSYKNVHIFNLFPLVHERLGQSIEKPLNASYQNVRYGAKYQIFSSIFLAYSELAVIVFAGFKVLFGYLTIGALFGFMRAYWVTMNAVNGLSQLVPTFARLDGKLDRIAEMLALVEEQEVPAPVNAVPVSPGSDSNSVELQAVNVGYGEEDVLNKLDFHIRPGEKILLEGPNGCGKSTLALCLSGFLPHSDGHLKVPDLSRVSAMYPDSFFLPGTVYDNVRHAYGRPQVEVFFEIHRLPERLGLRSILCADPEDLSQGQKRRVQLAMALCKDADLYILDEPLANIEEVSKKEVIELIFDVVGERSLMVIMHGDERFAARFDRIVDFRRLQSRAA